MQVSRVARLWAGLALVTVSAWGSQVDACDLLSLEAIRQATGEVVVNSKPTSQTSGKLTQSQCFYTLPTFSNSISVTLTSSSGFPRDAAREMWDRWFHREKEDKDEDRAGKPQAEEEDALAKAVQVAGIGDEAFWVQSFVGNLYVRKGGRFLRISIGGKMSDTDRRARAKTLGLAALNQLR